MTGAGCQSPRLLDPMRAVLRVRRYVKFHGMRGRADLEPGTAKVEAFLTHLAVAGRVAPATTGEGGRGCPWAAAGRGG